MCGIVGLINKNKADVLESQIRVMCSTIIHRGPDDEGVYLNRNVGIGMRRLNIIDLNTGHQPIHNEDKSIWIVFNGEIFNYKELKDYLLKKGHQFYTETDTEVIVHMYEEEGEECVQRFRGMFSFALYDLKKDQVFIARDRLGIKPLFYYENNDKIIFGSELKAILVFNDVRREINWKAFDAYFTLAYIPSPLTIYKDIYKLTPGHYLIVKNGKIETRKYWDIRFEPNRSLTEKKAIEKLLELLDEAVRLRLISDVPLGAFLSGGIDSSLIVALMSKYHSSVKTLTIGFGGQIGAYNDERKYAELVSKRYATDHREYEVKVDLINDNLIDKIVNAFDEPFADHGAIPTHFVCKMARENMTVALSGLGGDEAFSGYPRYLGFYISEIYRYFPKIAKNSIIPWLVEALPESKEGKVTVNWLKRFVRGGGKPPGERYLTYVNLLSGYPKKDLFSDDVLNLIKNVGYEEEFLGHFNAENATHPVDKVYYADIKTYLPDDILALTDRISMMHSLEVRVPFLDHKLMEFCATIPYHLKMKYLKLKYLLRRSASELLPKEVLGPKRQGFVGPMNMWLSNELKDYVYDTLLSGNSKDGFFEKETVSNILRQHYNREQLNTSLIWTLMVFKIWYRMYM